MQILDGKVVSQAVREHLKAEIAQMGQPPGLAVVLVGEDPASEVYVRNKIKACEQVGIRSFHHHLKAGVSFDEIKSLITNLNQDKEVHGILVQLPLPEHLDSNEVLELIDPQKDADGLNEKAPVKPCTPAGVMEILKHYDISPKGMRAVVIGRSKIVGAPMFHMLKAAGATVKSVHRGTENKLEITKAADLIVVAAGVKGLIGREDLKEGVIVVDVGIHRTDKGLCGDVRFDELKGFAKAATPVPGGVGPMTITMLLSNTLQLSKLN